MNAAGQTDTARRLASILFTGAGTANFIPFVPTTAAVNHNDILAAVQAIDAALDTTLTAATTAFGGTATIQQVLSQCIPAPMNASTPQQKTAILCMVLLKRAGLL